MGRPRTTTDQANRQGPPVAFRPGPDLEQLARPFVERHKLAPTAAYKCLAALALIGLDQRHYALVAQLAAVFVGDNPFSRACAYLQAAFRGVAAMRSGLVVEDEPYRSQLLFDVVKGFLRERDVEVDTTGLWFTPTIAPAPIPGPKHEVIPAAPRADESPAGGAQQQVPFGTRVKRLANSKTSHEERAARLAKEDGKSDESEG